VIFGNSVGGEDRLVCSRIGIDAPQLTAEPLVTEVLNGIDAAQNLGVL